MYIKAVILSSQAILTAEYITCVKLGKKAKNLKVIPVLLIMIIYKNTSSFSVFSHIICFIPASLHFESLRTLQYLDTVQPHSTVILHKENCPDLCKYYSTRYHIFCNMVKDVKNVLNAVYFLIGTIALAPLKYSNPLDTIESFHS